MGRIAFKGGTLIDGTGKEPIENSVILIEDNRIVKVGSEREIHIEKDYTIVDISNQIIMPGLAFRLCLGFPPLGSLCGRKRGFKKSCKNHS